MTKRKWYICPVCKGEGSHVNPNIDSHGISAEEFRDDPDFAEDYMSGTYDISCLTCQGTGKINQRPSTVLKKLREAADDRRLAAMEDGDYEAYQVAGDWRYGY